MRELKRLKPHLKNFWPSVCLFQPPLTPLLPSPQRRGQERVGVEMGMGRVTNPTCPRLIGCDHSRSDCTTSSAGNDSA